LPRGEALGKEGPAQGSREKEGLMAQYQYLTLTQAIAALRGRLQNASYWTDAELTLWLQDALRLWNAATETWRLDYALTPQTTPNLWNNLGTLADNPRLRTVTDAQLYTRMQYMLLEPPSGAGTWTGTSQFDLASMQYALDKRRNEVIQVASCNMAVLTLPSTPNTRSVAFPDTTLEPVRTRFIPGAGWGNPIWLSREDATSFDYWEPNYNQTIATPSAWDVITQPVLSLAVDTAPNVPGTYEAIVLQSGPAFAPPAATLLGVPDDWSFLPMMGALADLLDSEPERTDPTRAKYLRMRYEQGLKIIRGANWMVDASGENASSDVMSLMRADQYDPGWDNGGTSAFSEIIVGGMDFLAAPYDTSVLLALVGNMPFPTTGGGFLQVPRDVADVVLDYAQHLAMFKVGGEYFQATAPLYQGFLKAAMDTNKRLAQLGLYADVVKQEGRVQELDVPRM
jgi:hypothetical protein